MSKKKKILIVGGTGFLGYHLCKFFDKLKYDISSFSKSKPKKLKFLKNIKYFYGDISKKKDLKIFKNKDFKYVINCGGYVDHINKKKTLKAHYFGSKNLYETFKKEKLAKFIQIGSSAEYGNISSPQDEKKICKPRTVYGLAKYKATRFFLSKKNFPYIILRFYQIYGPYQDNNRFISYVINSCIKDKNFSCSDCTQSRDFLFIEDAIRAIKKCLITKKISKKIINIGMGKATNLRKVIEIVQKILKKGNPKYGIYKLRADEPKVIYPKTNLSKTYLGWRPKINLKTGLLKTINFYRKHKLIY